MGIAVYPDDGEDMETLIHLADVAMCQAKQGGRNSYQRSSPPKEGGEELQPQVTPFYDKIGR
jgi:hypothetical protein